MIPVVLVSGFLGSGKTSFLSNLASKYCARRIVYLVNEFSSVDVDGSVLRMDGAEVVAIPGGSIFCRCLVTEFISELRAILKKWHSLESPLEGLVIEASGISDPRVIGRMLAETQLDQDYVLATRVAVVEPGSFRKLLLTLPNIRAQVEAADVVLLNKTDLFSEEDVLQTEQAVLDVQPTARILRTVRSRVDLSVFDPAPGEMKREGDYTPCRDPNYLTVEVPIRKELDLQRVRRDILALGEDVYRVKGRVPTRDGPFLVDYSVGGLDLRPTNPGPGIPEVLVFVLRGDASSETRARLEALRGELQE